jgi:uncharacterized protein (AIM24 family)
MPDPIPPGPFDQGLFLTHLNKGREMLEARRFDDAERQLEEAYLFRPRDPRVLNLLGLTYFRGGKLQKAADVYRKLVVDTPDSATLHHNLGIICLKLGRLEDAESSFLVALRLSHSSPKIHFYLGSIYERLHRHKDAIHHYRQAGAHLMVQRVESKLAAGGPPTRPLPRLEVGQKDKPRPAQDKQRQEAEEDDEPKTKPPTRAPSLSPPPAPSSPSPPSPPSELPPAPPPALAPSPGVVEVPPPPLTGERKEVRPVSPFLMAEGSPIPSLLETARFQMVDDTLPPGTRARLVVPHPGGAGGPRQAAPRPGREVFRGLEKGLMEVDFSGKVFIKQGTIYSYSGNLTFWVKDKRADHRPTLVIVTGTGRLLLTDHDREITFMQVSDEPVFVEPSHLLACEEALQPRHVRLGEEQDPIEVIALEGSGMVALSVASKPLPLSVRPGFPVSVPAPAVIMWTGQLEPHVVDDPQVYAVVLPTAGATGRLLRLEGVGRILVEQTAS